MPPTERYNRTSQRQNHDPRLEGTMTPSDSLQLLLLPVGLVLLLVGICAIWLIARELSAPPRRWMAGLLATSFGLLSVVFLECVTGYYLAIPHAGIATCIVAIAAYFLAMFLLLFSRRLPWHLNRIIAIVGICTPIIIPILSPAILVVALFVVGTDSASAFHGRISPTASYKITVDQSLIGNGSFYGFTVYRNPRWLPFVQRKVENGPALSCEVPSEKVEIRPGKDANNVTLLCNTHGNQQPPQEIALH